MTKQEVLDAANVMIAYANGKKVGTRPRRSMEPLLKILYVPTWNWEQKDYCIIPDHAAKESLEQSQGGQAVSDTPRTDKIMFTVDVCDGEDVVNIAFARQLERELNVANLQMELLTKSNFQLREGRLELKQRIKRLEEENDALRADLLLWRDTEAK